MPETVTDHVNSQGERVSIDRVTDGELAGEILLVVWDDPPAAGGSGKPAPMMLDAGTRQWLRDYLDVEQDAKRAAKVADDALVRGEEEAVLEAECDSAIRYLQSCVEDARAALAEVLHDDREDR